MRGRDDKTGVHEELEFRGTHNIAENGHLRHEIKLLIMMMIILEATRGAPFGAIVR